MDQRIVEILMYVIGEIQSRRIRVDEIEGISDDLVQRGFSPREVTTAFSLFADRIQRDPARSTTGPQINESSHRILHEVERQYIGAEALGYILQLSHLGILCLSDVEELIERCMLMGTLNLGADEMKMVVATHLLEKEPVAVDSSISITAFRPWPEHVH